MDLNELRKRITSGGEYSREDLRDAISQLRTIRVEAAIKTTKKRVAAVGVSDSELDEQLAGFGLKL